MKKLAVFTATVLFALSVTAHAEGSATGNSSPERAKNEAKPAVASLIKTDEKVGTGKVAVSGMSVVVHYTGWLYDPNAPKNKGTKFDSSRDRGQPFTFPLGAGQVIRGWDQGVEGMKTGGRRTLVIPADLGYGARGAGGVIPPNATLIFDVELLEVR